jgi:hypothetical protein
MTSIAAAFSRAAARFYSTAARNVIHNMPKSQFEIALPEGETAYLRYEKAGKDFDLKETFVPKDQRGKGIAEDLAQKAFTFVKESEAKAVVNCSYIRDTYLPKHTEWKDVVRP